MLLRLTGVFLIVTASAAETRPISAQESNNLSPDSISKIVLTAPSPNALITQMDADGVQVSGDIAKGSFSDFIGLEPLPVAAPLSVNDILSQ